MAYLRVGLRKRGRWRGCNLRRPLRVRWGREPSWFECNLEINVIRVVRDARTKALIHCPLDRDEGELAAHEATARS
jgi:hypothetical protein